MNIKTLSMMIIWVVFSLSWGSICMAENWVKYFSNQAGYEFFIEKNTLLSTNDSEVRVWYKSSPADGQKGAWDEWSELRLVDCSKRKYKVLQGEIYSKDKIEKFEEQTTWTYLEPGALYESFYNAVCKSLK